MEDYIYQDIIVEHIGSHETEDRIQFITLCELKDWPKNSEQDYAYLGEVYVKSLKDNSLKKSQYLTETAMISIECFENIIDKHKKLGATHMSVDFHCDHESYVFDFSVIRLPSKEEEDKILEESNETLLKKRQKELKKLKEEMQVLSQEIQRLKNNE